MSFKALMFYLLGLCFFGCQSDEKPKIPTVDELQGHWVVDSAFRDGKFTETMEGAFFDFQGDKLSTNIYGTEESAGLWFE